MGNARASVCGIDSGRFHAFLCLYVIIRTTENATMTNQPTTLSNVDTKTCDGLTITAIPEVKIPVVDSDLTKRGVREECLIVKRREFPEEPDKHWYVLRVTYNREQQAYRYFRRHKITAYLPMRSYWEKKGERRVKVVKSLLSCMIFVYEKDEKLKRLMRETPSLSYLRYYYNKFAIKPDGTEEKLTLSYKDMLNFIVVTSVKSPYVRIVKKTECHFKDGDMVIVRRGDFKGVVGRVARVNGQSCVVVELRGVCLVATAYIRKEDLEKIQEKQEVAL